MGRLMDLISLVFRYAFAFHSHPTSTGAEAHLPTVLPSPLPVVAFQCKWVNEWLQLAHQKACPAEGPWWLRFSQATPPLPSPQHFVLTPLPPVPVYSLCPTWTGRLGTRGFKENWYSCLPLSTTVVSMKIFLKVAINLRHILNYLRVTKVGFGQGTKSYSISTVMENSKLLWHILHLRSISHHSLVRHHVGTLTLPNQFTV